MLKGFIIIFLLLFSCSISSGGELEGVEQLIRRMEVMFSGVKAVQWGEDVSGVKSRLATKEKVLALTLDACGSPKGKGVDQELIDYLRRKKIPATLFINARWIDANPELFSRLAADPLFEIGNHGMWHKPASINGRFVYGIDGTRDIAELVQEIELNARKIEQLTGKRPRFYRSGTAFYDEYAVQLSQQLGHQVIGFSLLGDAGATYSATQVKKALLGAKGGDIIIAHFNHPEAGTGRGIMEAVPELERGGFRFVKLGDYTLR